MASTGNINHQSKPPPRLLRPRIRREFLNPAGPHAGELPRVVHAARTVRPSLVYLWRALDLDRRIIRHKPFRRRVRHHGWKKEKQFSHEVLLLLYLTRFDLVLLEKGQLNCQTKEEGVEHFFYRREPIIF